MPKAIFKVEFSVGTKSKHAFKEAIRLAKLLDCLIEFDFNGIQCFVDSKSKVETLQERFQYSMGKGSKFLL